MPGGLLQLVANGQANTILTGNPTTTFFKAVYKHYTPFGLQRFRLDYDGLRNLSFDSPTEFNFKIKRYAEMLWDTYIVVNLPDIWSPLYDISGCQTYEYQWIKNLGFNMINQVTIYSGGSILAQYSGEWMQNAIERDETDKKGLVNRMTGNIPELYDPKSMHSDNKYPNAFTYINNNKQISPEPSIRGRKLYIPLMAWFCYSTKTALPLIALQYQEINIKVEFRSVKELFTIATTSEEREEQKKANKSQVPPIPIKMRKAPNSSEIENQMWRFLQEPPPLSQDGGEGLTKEELTKSYKNRRNDWNTDIHLIGTYIFLGDEERRVMAAQEHHTLVKTQYEWDYLNTTGSSRVDIPSRDMISSYMWRFRRSDVNDRNEWSNYQNYDIEDVSPDYSLYSLTDISSNITPNLLDCSNIYITPQKSIYNIKNIMTDLAILCGQDYRETTLDSGVYGYIEKWYRTSGFAKDGLYCYNFCTNTNRTTYQPTGAQNTNKWKHLTFEFNTIEPPRNTDDAQNSVDILCDASGAIIGVRKDVWKLNDYNFDLRIFEERYNMIEIVGGRIGLLCAR
jgi:hypothetical protein